jgi:hypothetical protein
MAHDTDHPANAVRYEATDAAPSVIAWLAGGMVLFLLLTPALLQVLYPTAMQDRQFVDPLPPEPRLQTTPQQDLMAERTREQGELSGYYWIDRQQGIVHIPIARAMSLVLDRGLPGWQKQ